MAGWSDKYKSQVEYLTGAGLSGDTNGGVSALSVVSTFIQAISLIIVDFPEYIENLQDQIESMRTEIEGLNEHIKSLQENKKDKEDTKSVYVKVASPSIELDTNRKASYGNSIGVFSNSSNNIKIYADRTVQGLYINGKAVTDSSTGFTSFKPNSSGNYLLTIKSENIIHTGQVTLTIADSVSDVSTNLIINMKGTKTLISKPYIASTYKHTIGKFVTAVNTIKAAPKVTTTLAISKSVNNFENLKTARNINYVQITKKPAATVPANAKGTMLAQASGSSSKLTSLK